MKEKLKEKEVLYSDKNIRHAITGQLETPIGTIKVLSTELLPIDKISNFKVRLGIGRDDYAIPPGIYAIGEPNEESDVMVTCNYKLTIDKLRTELGGLNLWILVLDTFGVNVWCAAGKGTFSTEEIIFKVKKYKLSKLVNHKTLILPQLCGPGVSAYQITKFTGFKAVFGPIYASDIKDYINNNLEARDYMRRVRFNLKDRVAVSPIEALAAIKYLPFIYIFFVGINCFSGGYSLVGLLTDSLLNTLAYGIAIIIGSVVFPMIMPVLPFRMFSLKAGVLGVLWSLVVFVFSGIFGFNNSILISLSNLFLFTSIISFLGFNFTGSTTFTSLSGVKKESRMAMPVIMAMFILGIILMILQSIFLRF